MRRLLGLLILLLISQMAYAQTSMKNDLAALRNSLSENAVVSIVVLRMPDDVTTRVAVTPQVLRQLPPPGRKYTIKMSHSRSQLLIQWINEAKPAPRNRCPDLRWGLLFMGRDGKEVASIFSDRFGSAGNIDGHNVEFPDTRMIDTIHGLVGSEVH
jgi:hypothetical protein